MARKKTKNKRVLKFQMYKKQKTKNKKQKTYRRIRFNKNKTKFVGGVNPDLKALVADSAIIDKQIATNQSERGIQARLLYKAVLMCQKNEKDAIENGDSSEIISSLHKATEDALNKHKTFTQTVVTDIIDEDIEKNSLQTAISRAEARSLKRATSELKKD